MSSVMSSLKLVSAKRNTEADQVVSRRQHLSQRVKEQIALATALKAGDSFIAKRIKHVKNESTGISQVQEVNVKLKEWWFVNGNKVCVQLRYANRVLPLNAKGDRNGVEVDSADEMIAVLKKLDEAILNGELDAQIQTVSSSIRAKLKH